MEIIYHGISILILLKDQRIIYGWKYGVSKLLCVQGGSILGVKDPTIIDTNASEASIRTWDLNGRRLFKNDKIIMLVFMAVYHLISF